jgi:galactose oxidase
MAEEVIDRYYHFIALLLLDGRVLSAGGGEYTPNNPNLAGQPNVNPVRDIYINTQIFNSPYLFKGDRPIISIAINEITYDYSFKVIIRAADKIAIVSLVKLGSVTHSFNINRLLTFLYLSRLARSLLYRLPLMPTS